MNRTRLLSVLVSLALALAAGLVVRQAWLTEQTVEAANQAAAGLHAGQGSCVGFEQGLHSFYSVYDADLGLWVARSDAGVLGIDGGLLELGNCLP